MAVHAGSKGCEISLLVQNQKESYTENDTITVLVKVLFDQDFCDDAGKATKIFSKGLKIEKRSVWKKLSENSVGQKLVLTVLKDYKKGTITAYRKTEHYNCFKQLDFKFGL